MRELQLYRRPVTVDFGFGFRQYHHPTTPHLLTHLLLTTPSFLYIHLLHNAAAAKGGDCSLYVGADEISRASGELFKREDYESSFLAHC